MKNYTINTMILLLAIAFSNEGIARNGQTDPINRLLNHIEQQDPEQARELRELRENDPAAFREALHERLNRVRERIQAAEPDRLTRDRQRKPEESGREGPRARRPHQEGDVDVRRHDVEIRNLVQQYREATTDEQREELRKALKDEVTTRFDQREDARRIQLEQLKQSVERLRAVLEERAEQREELIDQRVESLLRRIDPRSIRLPDQGPLPPPQPRPEQRQTPGT